MSDWTTDGIRRPTTVTCPRCRPGNVQAFSWPILEGQFWASVLWCDVQGCRADIVCSAHAMPTRAEAEASALRIWSDRAGAEARVGSMSEQSKRILSGIVELAKGGAA